MTKYFLIAFLLAPLHAYSVRSIQNDFSQIVLPEESMTYNIKNSDDDLKEVKVDENEEVKKLLVKMQKKLDELEEGEKIMREKMKRARNEEIIRFREDQREKEDTEGFWKTICRIGKGILSGILRFLGIKI